MKRVGVITATSLAFALLVVGGGACGYRPVYGGASPTGRLAVVAAPARIPHPEVVEAVVAGAQEELSRAGVLGTAGYPRLVVEVVRVDELGAGIRDTGGAPLARGTTVSVAAHAWVEEHAGDPPARDTGDLRRSEAVTVGADPIVDSVGNREALRSAGRQLGRAIGRRVLGDPEPSDEP